MFQHSFLLHTPQHFKLRAQKLSIPRIWLPRVSRKCIRYEALTLPPVVCDHGSKLNSGSGASPWKVSKDCVEGM